LFHLSSATPPWTSWTRCIRSATSGILRKKTLDVGSKTKDFAGENREKVLGADLRRAPLHWVLPNESLGLVIFGRVCEGWWCYAFWLERRPSWSKHTHIGSISYVHTDWWRPSRVTKMRSLLAWQVLHHIQVTALVEDLRMNKWLNLEAEPGTEAACCFFIQAAFRHTRIAPNIRSKIRWFVRQLLLWVISVFGEVSILFWWVKAS